MDASKKTAIFIADGKIQIAQLHLAIKRKAMIVLLKNIQKDTLRSEIIKFISPIVKGGFFRAKGEIKFIRILEAKDSLSKLIEYHALVSIEPDKVAMRVIEKLHSKHFKGKRITVREYRKRRPPIDGGVSHHHNQRREIEITEIDFPQVEGDRKFHRTYQSRF